jgi:hypothetical protein
MVEKSQEYLRLALAAAAILIGLSIAYHYVIYIPEKDREQRLQAQSSAEAASLQATEKQAALAKAAEARRTNYRVCMSSAMSDYHDRWNSTCKRLSDAASKSRAQCIAGGASQETCESYYPSLPASDCALSNPMSSSYDDMLKDEEKQCLDQANAGVLDE